MDGSYNRAQSLCVQGITGGLCYGIIVITSLLGTGGGVTFVTWPTKVPSPAGIDLFPAVPAHITDKRLIGQVIDGNTEWVSQPKTVYLGTIAVGIAIVEGIIGIPLSGNWVDTQDFSVEAVNVKRAQSAGIGITKMSAVPTADK